MIGDKESRELRGGLLNGVGAAIRVGLDCVSRITVLVMTVRIVCFVSGSVWTVQISEPFLRDHRRNVPGSFNGT